MDIKFVELLEKTGDTWKALFDVNGESVIIGISDTLVSVWDIQRNKNIIELFLKQFGALKIQLMIAEGNMENYTFISDHFKKENSQAMTLGEVKDYLEAKIIETEDKPKST